MIVPKMAVGAQRRSDCTFIVNAAGDLINGACFVVSPYRDFVVYDSHCFLLCSLAPMVYEVTLQLRMRSEAGFTRGQLGGAYASGPDSGFCTEGHADR